MATTTSGKAAAVKEKEKVVRPKTHHLDIFSSSFSLDRRGFFRYAPTKKDDINKRDSCNVAFYVVEYFHGGDENEEYYPRSTFSAV